MYQIENTGQVLRATGRRGLRALRWPRVNRNVVFLGLTSFFTDISSEMVTAILPLYVLFTLRAAPLQFGLIDGLYQGAAVIVRMASGLVADRRQNHKIVASAGYALSAACKPGFLIVQNAWAPLAGLVLVDRIGKGIRTAPRDALISMSTPRASLATAFGVHRALDTAGAMLGPLVAFAVLTIAPEAFDAIFVVSFCLALIGVAVVTLFVENRVPSKAADEPHDRTSIRTAAQLLRGRRYRALTIAGSLLGLMTISDAFIYLGLQRRADFDLSLFPLLYVGTALIYMVLAVPVGRVADLVGRSRVYVLGYVLLVAAYGTLLTPVPALLPLVLLGAYYAATDGVLMALASAVVPAHARASGLALLATATSLARLLASVLFGLLWTWWGIDAGVLFFLVGLLAAIAVTAVALARAERATPLTTKAD